MIFSFKIYSLEEWEKDRVKMYSKSAITQGGTYIGSFGDGEVTIIEDGVIKNYSILYEAGISDAEIAQWQHEASTNRSDYNSSEADSNTSSESTNNSDNSNSLNTEKQNESVLSQTYTDEEIEAAWEETNRVESTCTEAGYIEYTNSLTKETKTEELELAKHQYEETERTEPTCTEEGTVTYTCSVCGNTYDETLPATGHSYKWVTTKEAGLFTDGLEEEVCSICGEKSGATHTLSAKIANSVVLLIICGIIIVTVGASSFILLHKRQAKNVLQSKKS